MYVAWSKEETNALIAYVNKGFSIKKISSLIDGRSEESVRQRIKFLNLKVKYRGRQWTKKDEERFAQDWLHSNKTMRQLKTIYHRSQAALQQKALVMKLGPRLKPFGLLTVMEVAKGMNVSDDIVYSWIKKGLTTRKSQVQKPKYYISVYSLLDFLKEHPKAYDASLVNEDILFNIEPDWFIEKRKADKEKYRKNKQNFWTAEEDNKLRELVEKQVKLSAIAKTLDRTEYATQTRISDMGLSVTKSYEYRNVELDILRNNVADMSLTEIKEKLLPWRSIRSLKKKCTELGLSYFTENRNHIIYTKEEDEILRKYSDTLTVYEIQEQYLPKRTVKGIQSRCEILGLKAHISKNFKAKSYSEAEIQLLKEYSGVLPLSELIKHMENRTIRGLERKCRELNLPYTTNISTDYTEHEIETLKKYAGKIPTDELVKMFPNRTKRGILCKCNRLGIRLKN